jgi:hypothetical protein
MSLPGGQGDGRALQQETLACIECGKKATGHAVGFKAYVADDGELVMYCPVCAEREFGEDTPDPPGS